MARRLHSSTLGGSRKWAALESDSHRMLYERVIDITDAYGRFDADPVMVKAQAIPRLATSIDEVEAALDDMERVGLIERWEVAGNPYGYIVAFEKFNNLDPAKEAQTTIPGPDGITPTRPARTDRSKPKASPKRTQRKPVASATPDPGVTEVDPGREVGKPRAEDGQELGTLYGYGYGYGYVDEEQELNPPTPQKAEPLPPPDVEAAPRRELSRSSKGIQKGKARDPNAVRAIDQPFVDAWNENRGPLPSVLSLDQGRRRHLDKLRAELGDEALDVFTDATKQLAREPFYRQKGYGLTQLLAAGNLLTWAEKWRSTGGMSDQDRRLADKARAVADAIGGL